MGCGTRTRARLITDFWKKEQRGNYCLNLRNEKVKNKKVIKNYQTR